MERFIVFTWFYLFNQVTAFDGYTCYLKTQNATNFLDDKLIILPGERAILHRFAVAFRYNIS